MFCCYMISNDQMIPHHINAINMAKAALKLRPERVGNAWDEMGIMMYSMINVQTEQVAFMQDYLHAVGAAAYDPEEQDSACALLEPPPPPTSSNDATAWFARHDWSFARFLLVVSAFAL
eukprot:SAG31_NODE_173_length_21354_cov_16.826112_23_plen_119_part_00